MRKRISVNIRGGRLINIIVGSGFIIFLINLITEEEFDLEKIFIILCFVFLNVIMYFLFDNAKYIEYDNQYFYIISKNTTEQIPLKNIYAIKMISMELNKKNFWKIKYYDNNNDTKAVRFLPVSNHKIFYNFIEDVKVVNSELKTQNWTHSFDIDI